MTDPAEVVLETTKRIAREFGVDMRLIEEDFNGPPGGTTDYDGRAQAFQFWTIEGRELRVLVEDVTIDEGER